MRRAALPVLVSLLSLCGAASAAPLVGDFVAADSEVDGAWVTFRYTPERVLAYTLSGTRLFDVEVTGTPSTSGAFGTEARGATLRVRTPLYELEAIDVPDGHLAVTADGSMVVRFGPEAILSQAAPDRVAVTVGDVRGLVFSPAGPVTVDGPAIRAEQAVSFLATFDDARGLVADAAADRRVGAVVAATRAADGVELAVADFAGIRVEAETIEDGVRFRIESDGLDGRVLVFDLDPDLLGTADPAAVEVRYDGAAVRDALSADDALDADDDGLAPERWIESRDGAFRVLASVPHWSVHSLEVVALRPVALAALAAGVVVGVGMVLGGGALLFRRRG
ncbi:MAG TPA: hypothetical protein VI997_08785 [Candidatus Thermoplasmatota archaeon]|nr:hypothetical protein [Candidatus Thermoplasmatota archaeon]